MSDRINLLVAGLVADYTDQEKQAQSACGQEVSDERYAERMALGLRPKPVPVKHQKVNINELTGGELKIYTEKHLSKYYNAQQIRRITKNMTTDDFATFLVEAVCQHFYKGKKPHCTYRKTRRLKLLSREAYNKCKVIARKSASGYESDQSIHD